jgi:hypothetical protein
MLIQIMISMAMKLIQVKVQKTIKLISEVQFQCSIKKMNNLGKEWLKSKKKYIKIK